MRMIRFAQIQRLSVDLDTVWNFCSNPANLSLITPPDLCFTLTSPVPERMHSGMIATYTVAPFGQFRVKWVTEITHVVHPVMFVDEQRFGPYRFWHHQHHFRELGNGVEMHDIIHYSLPLDPFSRALSGLVARRLEYIFAYRRTALGNMFGMKVE
jgi:ligand-binding SRPBCC domain-containing protein